MGTYIFFFLLSFIVSYFLALVVKAIAFRFNIVDDASEDPARKRHVGKIPLLGGWAIFGAVQMSIGLSLLMSSLLVDSFLFPRQIVGIVLGGLVLMIGGTLDDKKRLSAGRQILWPAIASFIVILFGIGIPYITNPFGGVIVLDSLAVNVITINGIAYHFTVFADIFTFVWLMVLMYATKFLDGLDGLASGVGVIGAVMVFILSLTKTVNQPGTALFAIIIAGALLGFFMLNRAPAKIFLGEGGSVYVGFLLGLLSIISGGKIATALLVLAFPLLDVLWVIIARLFKRKKIWQADRLHLHFRLLDRGWSVRSVVGLFFVVSFVFGLSALVLDAKLKALFFVIAAGISLFIVIYASRKTDSTQQQS
jgi:UDP-GlcNAc:undecaprenyl-phosphate GlcNAc-1-phosphate transferase